MTNPSKFLLSFRWGNGSPNVFSDFKRFGFQNWGEGGKIEGRHILIIALSDHHLYYMNRKGWSLRYYAGGEEDIFSMYTLDSKDSCMAPGFWQTLISIAEVRKIYFRK